MILPGVLEAVTGASGTAPRIEGLLPSGVRPRQLTVRTLLPGMMLTAADGRPAHLTRVHHALVSLPDGEQRRPGRPRGLEARPAPADLPAGRVHLQPGHRSVLAATWARRA